MLVSSAGVYLKMNFNVIMLRQREVASMDQPEDNTDASQQSNVAIESSSCLVKKTLCSSGKKCYRSGNVDDDVALINKVMIN